MGFCNSGYFYNRIAIPIFDMNKSLAAYCGRTILDNTHPKYLFPKYFKKNNHLFNIQNIIPHSPNPLFIVEGFFACIHLVKSGFDSVALMGSTISLKQLQLLKVSNRNCILMLDGDEAGKKATYIISKILRNHHIPFDAIHLGDNIQPDSLDHYTIKFICNIK